MIYIIDIIYMNNCKQSTIGKNLFKLMTMKDTTFFHIHGKIVDQFPIMKF